MTDIPASQLKSLMDSPQHLVRGRLLIDAQGLTKSFGGQTVLRDANLALHSGEVVLLRGDNGSGKTTLVNVLTGNLPPDSGSINVNINGTREHFQFPRSLWQQLNPLAQFSPECIARAGIGRAWQEIRLFHTQSLINNVAVASPNQRGENPLKVLLAPHSVRIEERHIQAEAQHALEDLNLGDRGTSSADHISLGQAKRVAILRALQAKARVIFLDEPLAGLDSAGATEILGLLQALVRERDTTLVIIEHVLNIPRVLDLATTVWTLRDGKITIETPDDVRIGLRDIATKGIQNRIRGLAPVHKRTTHKLPGGAALTILSLSDRPGEPILEVEDLAVFRGARLVLGETQASGRVCGVSFILRRGELGILEASNGWGKTTLLETVAGILPTARGTIKVAGQDVTRLSAWDRRSCGLSMLQSRDNVFSDLNVRESLELSGLTSPYGLPQRFMSRRMSELSGGEKQRIALACALEANHINLALLDEPFAALDNDAVDAALYKMIERLRYAGILLAIPGGFTPPEGL